MVDINNSIGNDVEWVYAPERLQPDLLPPSIIDARLTNRLAQFFLRNPDSKVTLMHLSRVLDYDYTVQAIVRGLEHLMNNGFITYEDDGRYKQYSLTPEVRKRLE